jgi:hypothetical protein
MQFVAMRCKEKSGSGISSHQQYELHQKHCMCIGKRKETKENCAENLCPSKCPLPFDVRGKRKIDISNSISHTKVSTCSADEKQKDRLLKETPASRTALRSNFDAS